MPKFFLMMSAAGVALASATAAAQDRGIYVAGNVGGVLMGESSNSGRFTENFEPGLVDAVLADGAAYRFDSTFETGIFASLALGKTTVYGPFRSEIEVSFTDNNVKDHGTLEALGQNLDGTDVAVLLGADEEVGISTGRVLSDAKGNVRTISFMVNGFYDIPVSSQDVRPFIGVGVGVTQVSVDYDPSGLGLIDDDATAFGYQAMAGVDYAFDDVNTLHAGVRYRGTTSIEVETDALFASDVDIDVDQFIAEIGWRRSF